MLGILQKVRFLTFLGIIPTLHVKNSPKGQILLLLGESFTRFTLGIFQKVRFPTFWGIVHTFHVHFPKSPQSIFWEMAVFHVHNSPRIPKNNFWWIPGIGSRSKYLQNPKKKAVITVIADSSGTIFRHGYYYFYFL